MLAIAVLTATEPARAADGPCVTDDMGEQVCLEHPARRIIALYGALNETLLALDLGDRLVARTRADTEPVSLAALPSIGTHMRPNAEMILGLAPDLVLQMGGRKEALESVRQLRDLGVSTAFFKATDFEELFSVIRRLGVLTGAQTKARELEQAMRDRLGRVAAALPPDGKRTSVVFEVRYPNLLGAGKGGMVHAVLEAAGARNCVSAQKKFLRLGEEELIRLDPDAYIVQRGPMNPAPLALSERPHYAVLSAVRNGRVLVVDERKYSRPGPRSVEAVEELFRFLYPERACAVFE